MEKLLDCFALNTVEEQALNFAVIVNEWIQTCCFFFNFKCAGSHPTHSALHDYGEQVRLPVASYQFKVRVFKVNFTSMAILCYYICVSMHL